MDKPKNFCGKNDIYDSPPCGYKKTIDYQCAKCQKRDLFERIQELEAAIRLIKDWDMDYFMCNAEFCLPQDIREIIQKALDKTEEEGERWEEAK